MSRWELFHREMMRMAVVYNTGKGATTEELNERSGIYYELLSEVPTESFIEVFKAAKTKELHFPRPNTLLKHWEAVRAGNAEWRKNEEKKLSYQDMKQNPSDYPTHEQHEGAIKTIMAVLDRRVDRNTGLVIDVKRGHEILQGIFDGTIK